MIYTDIISSFHIIIEWGQTLQLDTKLYEHNFINYVKATKKVFLHVQFL